MARVESYTADQIQNMITQAIVDASVDAAAKVLQQSISDSMLYAPIDEPLSVGLTGNTDIDGLKNFLFTPTVNGIPVALVGGLVPVAPEWSSSQVGPGVVGSFYTFTYIATGTPKPTYFLSAGTLPPGLTLTTIGVLSGTPLAVGDYTFTVTATNSIDPDIIRERTISITATIPLVGTGVFGAGMGYDGKGNQQINGVVASGAGRMAVRFRATANSNLYGVRFTQRFGASGYSLGTGGTLTVEVRPDDGYGKPHASTVLASLSFAPGNTAENVEKYDLKIFSIPPSISAGTIYHIVFTNPDANNFISVNNLYNYVPKTPRQPRFPDSDFAVLESSPNTWSFTSVNSYTPVIDVVYTNGVIDGQCYYESMNPQSQNIQGVSKRVRENILVSGGNKTVASVYVRMKRTSGTSPLIMTLKDASGTTVNSVSVPATNIPISASGVDVAGAEWVGGVFSTPATLVSGNRYFLELSTAEDTIFSTWPIRAKGNPESYQSFSFTSGVYEYATAGTNWARGYYDPYQVNMQMYFNTI